MNEVSPQDIEKRVSEKHDLRPIGSLEEYQAKVVRFADWATRNFGKPVPCKLCGKLFDYFEPWSPLEWNTCKKCGFERVKTRLGTPKRFWNADLLHDFPKYSLDTHELLLKKSLWIHGPVGTGKTHLAFAICHKLIQMGETSIIFEELKDIANRLKGTYKPPKWKSEDQVLAPFLNHSIVFIDDIYGSRDDGKPDMNEQEALRILARDLNNKEAHVIFTSNYNFEDLEKNGFNARTTSRLAELCNGGVLFMDGFDHRLMVNGEVPAV